MKELYGYTTEYYAVAYAEEALGDLTEGTCLIESEYTTCIGTEKSEVLNKFPLNFPEIELDLDIYKDVDDTDMDELLRLLCLYHPELEDKVDKGYFTIGYQVTSSDIGLHTSKEAAKEKMIEVSSKEPQALNYIPITLPLMYDQYRAVYNSKVSDELTSAIMVEVYNSKEEAVSALKKAYNFEIGESYVDEDWTYNYFDDSDTFQIYRTDNMAKDYYLGYVEKVE